ncbi:MAG: filamentous hemagglutinin family protein, partial [Paracoccaceae bacterium]
MTHHSIVPPFGSSATAVLPGRRRLWASSALVAAAAIAPGAAFAGPTGGRIVAGDASIAQAGPVTTITQRSARAGSEWDSLDTSVSETVRVVQPGADSVHIARVLSDDPTNFRGALEANGNLWVINRSGITFHDTARVNVGGLIATTSDIDTGKFMAGSNTFDIAGKPGASVVNKGAITFGEAGLAALVGAHASNEGVIYGRVGAVAIEGRQTFAVDVSGGEGILALETSAGTAAAVSASNTGLIDAGGSYVVISAEETAAALESLVTAGGTITAGAVDGHLGQVAIEGRTTVVSGVISAAGGTVDVRGDTVTMKTGASIDVSGTNGGGTVALGGGLRGTGRRADHVAMEAGATIAADGLGNSDGGLVTLWATDFTGFAGDISARGGDFGGDGGFVEVSAAGTVGFWGSVITLAPLGATGTLLIDPHNIEIVNSGGGPAVDVSVAGGGTTRIGADNISNLVAGTNLILEARDDITVIDAVNAAATVNITLRAGDHIIVEASLETAGSITLSADHDFSGSGGNAANGTGGITVESGSNVTGTTGLIMTVGASDLLTVEGNSTFTSGGALLLPTTTLTGTAAASFVTLAGAITQAGDFTAIGDTSANFTSFAGVDLTTHTNDILALSGSAGGNASFTLGQTVAFGFNAGANTIALTTSGGLESVTTNAGDAVIASTLTLAVDGNVALTEATNLIGGVDGTTSGTFELVNSGDLDLGFATTVPTSMNVTTTAASGTGALTQSTDISSALTLNIAGAATLTRAGNTFSNLTATTGAASSFTTATTLILGASAFTGSTAITVSGAGNGLTQSGAITGSALVLNVDGATTLTLGGNSFTGLSGSTGAASSFNTAATLDLGASAFTGATAITVSGAGNDLTQSGAITSGALVLNVADVTTLTEATNSFTGLTATTGAASSFTTAATLDLGASAFTGSTAITVSGAGNDLTQSGAITGGALVLNVADDAVLDDGANSFISLAGSAGNIGTFETTTGLSLAYTTAGLLTVTTGGNLTSGGPVNAGGLVLGVTGTAALGNTTNTVGALTGTVTGALTYVDDGALSLGISADTMTITAGGAITDGSGPVITTAATSNGDAAFFAFTDGSAGDVSDDTFFDITFTDGATSFAGDLSVSGNTIAIATTGALDVVDAYAATAATFESGGALTLTRVAVGTESGASGTDITIDTPGDLLGIGTSVAATDIIAADVTLGGAGSTSGTATALTGAVSIANFDVAALTLGAATTTDIANGVSSGGLTVGDSGALTVTSVDAGGTGTVTLAQTTGTMIVDGLIADGVDLSADDVALGFIRTTGTLDVAATGTILTIADASIAVPGAVTIDAPVLDAAAGPDVTDGATTYAAPARLLEVDGAASFDAAEDMFLVGTAAGTGFENDFKSSITFTDSSAGGTARVALEDANDIDIGGIGASGAEIQFAAIAAGAHADVAGSITQSGTAHVSADLTLITGDDGAGGPLGNVTMTLANELTDVAVRAHDAAITSSTDFVVAGTLDGDATLIGSGILTISGLTARNVSMAAAEVHADDSSLSGTLDIDATGAAVSSINNMIVAQAVTVDAAATTEFVVSNSRMEGLNLAVAVGRATITGSVLGTSAAAPATITADSALIGNVAAEDLSVLTTNLIEFGALTTTGDLALESTSGSVLMRDATDLATFGPSEITGGGVVVTTFGINTSASIGNPSTDDRVSFDTAGITRPAFTPVAAGVALEVQGNALFIAGTLSGAGALVAGAGNQDVILTPTLSVELRGAVTARVDGDFTIRSDVGGIVFDVPGATVTPSGATIGETGGTTAENAAAVVLGALSITTTDAAAGDVADGPDDTAGPTAVPLDAIIVTGTANFDLTGDLALDGIDGNSTHSFGNVVTVTAADDVTLGVDGGLSLGNVTANSLTVRSTGNIDDGAGTTLNIATTASFAAVNDNNTSDVSDDTYGGVSINNATHDFDGAVSAAGSFIEIHANDSLTVTDAWGETGMFVSAAGDLTMTRVAVGSRITPSGPGFAIAADATLSAEATGAIAVTDVIASALLLSGAGGGDPTGDVSVTRFAVDTLDFGTPTAGLALQDGVITGALTLNAPGDLTVINIETGGADATLTAGGTATVSGLVADNLTITAADALLGFLQVASALYVNTTGTIAALDDATLAGLIPTGGGITVAAPDLPLSVPSTDVAATGVITDVTLATTAMTRLISVGGPTELHAATSIVLAGTAVGGGFENDHLQIAVIDDDGAGTPMNVVIEDANDIAIAALEGADITIRAGTDAGATGDISQFAGIVSSGTASFIIEDDGAGNRGAVLLTNGGNAFTNVALSAGAANIVDLSGFNIVGAQIDDLLTVNLLNGTLGLTDVTAGSIVVDTLGAISGTRIETAGALTLDSDAGIALVDMVAGGTADLTAIGALTLDRFAMGVLNTSSTTSTTLENGSAGAITAGGTALALRNVTAASLNATISGGATTGALRTAGDLTINALSGDIDLGRTAVGGALTLEAVNGAITTRDATDGAEFSSPGSAVTVAGAGALTIGLDAFGVTGVSDDRVQATLTGSSGAAVASPAVTAALEVTNDAYFRAIGGDVSITTAADGALASFGGDVMLTTNGAATIEAAGDLNFAAVRATTLGGATFIPNLAIFANNALLVRANADGNTGTGADIAQTGFINVGGTATLISGVHSGSVQAAELGTITLTDAANVFSGAVSALGNDVSLVNSTDLTLADVTAIAAGGAGSVTAISDGLINASDVTADGAIDLNAATTLDMTDVNAGITLTGAAGGDIIGTDIGATGAIDLSTVAGAVDVLRVTGSDALDLTATTTLDATDVTVDGTTVLGAGGAMTLTRVDAGTGTMTANAVGTIGADTLDADGAMVVASSGDAVTATGLTAGNTLNIGALGTATVSNATAGTTVDLASTSGALLATDVTGDGAMTLGAGTTMTLTRVDAGTGTMTANAVGTIGADTLDADGAMV